MRREGAHWRGCVYKASEASQRSANPCTVIVMVDGSVWTQH